MAEFRKRETAYKLRIGDILSGTPIVEDIPQEVAPNPNETISSQNTTKERFRFLELGDKKIIRVNVIANIVDKYESAGEKRYSTITIDDATGQIRAKAFGDGVDMIKELTHGDTIIIIGVLRSYGGEVYISPEIVKKADPRYLLVRKLEIEGKSAKQAVSKESATDVSGSAKVLTTREQIIEIIKSEPNSSGVSTEEIILKIKSASPEIINSEIIRLIEDGMIYEPRPSRVRWLG